jgi:hypothetical protein
MKKQLAQIIEGCTIEMEEVDHPDLHVIELIAKCGETERRHRITLGEHGTLEEMKAEIQRQADELAERCASADRIGMMKKQLFEE